MVINVKFVDEAVTESHISGQIILSDENEIIGTYEGSIGLSNELISVIKVNYPYDRKGLGFESFKRVFNILSQEREIDSIVGAWYEDDEFSYLEESKSTNLLVFQRNTEKGLANEDAALNTPTGKWARK